MRPVAFPAAAVADVLDRPRVASMDELRQALGGPSKCTVHRKLRARHTARASALRGRSAPGVARRDSEIVRLDPSGVQELPLRPPASPTRIPRPPSNLLADVSMFSPF